MFAIHLDENNYLKTYSNRFRKPKSILVNAIPNETDIEKLRCYQFIDGNFVLNEEKWAEIEAKRAEMLKNESAAQEIAALQAEYQESNLKVIECIISFLTGHEMPYSIRDLHTRRQEITKNITSLKATMNA